MIRSIKNPISHYRLCVIWIRSSINVYISKKLLKDKIFGIYVTQFQLDYIHDTTKTSHKKCLSYVLV